MTVRNECFVTVQRFSAGIGHAVSQSRLLLATTLLRTHTLALSRFLSKRLLGLYDANDRRTRSPAGASSATPGLVYCGVIMVATNPGFLAGSVGSSTGLA